MKHIGRVKMSGSLFGEDDDPGESVGVGALPDECDRIGDAPQVDGVENGLKKYDYQMEVHFTGLSKAKHIRPFC